MFSIWVIYNNETLPNIIHYFAKVGSKYCPKQYKHSKYCQNLSNFDKGVKFRQIWTHWSPRRNCLSPPSCDQLNKQPQSHIYFWSWIWACQMERHFQAARFLFMLSSNFCVKEHSLNIYHNMSSLGWYFDFDLVMCTQTVCFSILCT